MGITVLSYGGDRRRKLGHNKVAREAMIRGVSRAAGRRGANPTAPAILVLMLTPQRTVNFSGSVSTVGGSCGALHVVGWIEADLTSLVHSFGPPLAVLCFELREHIARYKAQLLRVLSVVIVQRHHGGVRRRWQRWHCGMLPNRVIVVRMLVGQQVPGACSRHPRCGDGCLCRLCRRGCRWDGVAVVILVHHREHQRHADSKSVAVLDNVYA
mmetsp:Transcript_26032/g.68321  ORF Transcript_26032/g.68321 Transcript_26032/m.68321 type:complete len:212 (-) Transcript_26032:216-851(-)